MPEIPSIDLDNISNKPESKHYNTYGYNHTRKSIANTEKNDPDTFTLNDEGKFNKELEQVYLPKQVKNPVKHDSIGFKAPKVTKDIGFRVPKIGEK